MDIGSWWKKLTKREDAEAMREAEERSYETPEERRISSSDVEGLAADEVAARGMHEPNIADADRLGEGNDE
jgi:hypothetical protein